MGRWRGDREGVVAAAWPDQWVERGRSSIGSGEGRREVSGEEGVVRGVGASSMWGQRFRVSGCFSSVKGVVRGVVMSVG